MDIITTPPYEKMQEIYNNYFSLGFLGKDISEKFALISLTNYLVSKLKAKKPDVTPWSVLYKINNGTISEDKLKGLSVVCSDFAYGCSEFPIFGIKDKEIPKKIKELLDKSLPFQEGQKICR